MLDYKIVVTANAFSKNSFLVDRLKTLFSNVTLNTTGRYSKEELLNNLQDADAAIVGLDQINDSLLCECTNLKIVAKYGVGLDNIDIEACKKHNVKVGWTGGVNKNSVAEMTLGYMLMLIRNLYVTSNQLKDGEWNKSGGHSLTGKTIGIIGVGHIGKEVIRLLKPFNCSILVNDVIEQKEYYTQNALQECSKDEIFKKADIISVHTPLTEETKNLITLNEMRLMKASSFIINTARGGIINENDLKTALKKGIIMGAAIDAYEIEPPKDEDFIILPNLICTPHIGGNSKEAVNAMGISAIKHLEDFFKDI